MKTITRYLIVVMMIGMGIQPFAPSEAGETLGVGQGMTPQTGEVEALLAQMTLAEKVGQLFMVALPVKSVDEPTATFLRTTRPGAIVLFGSNTQGQTPTQIATLINEFQAIANENNIPLIVAVDQEGGRIRRLTDGFTYFPDPLGLGATTDHTLVQAVGYAQGQELHAIGVNMNLAPVADLHTRTDMLDTQRVMHRRTFGDNPQRVGAQVVAYVEGLRQAHVAGVVKHFPGHGGAEDSHFVLPTVQIDYLTAADTVFLPFRIAAENDVPAIMAGHLYYVGIEAVPDLPASLSPVMLQILRHDYGYEGVIITDAINMGAITRTYSISDASVKAIQAGADMIAMGLKATMSDQQAAMQVVMDAVIRGDISEARLDESVRRILQLKQDFGILEWTPVDTTMVQANIYAVNSEAVLERVYRNVVTVLQDQGKLLPLRSEETVAFIYPIAHSDLIQACAMPQATFYGYQSPPTAEDIGQAHALGEQRDKVVLFLDNATVIPEQLIVAGALPPLKTIAVALESPYDLEGASFLGTLIALYNNFPASRRAVCDVLRGNYPAQGRLPMAIENFPSGYSLLDH